MKKIIISLLSVLFLCSFSFAQNNKSTPFNYYIYGNATYNSIGGDFDGKVTYEIENISSDHTVFLPKIKPAVGWELCTGFSKGNHRINFAIGYTKFSNATFESKNDITGSSEIEDAYLGYYEANYGYKFLNKKRLNLLGLIGLGVNTKTANGAYEEFLYTGYTKYEDLNLNIGVNMEYYITKRLYFNSTVMYKLSNHGMVEISRYGDYNITGLNGSWLSINLGFGVKLGKTEDL